MTPADQTEAIADEGSGDTNVPVEPGENLSERQLLDGLMVHSANNFADVLARWDLGTVPAFVAKMNTTAAALGMTSTHYADASGLDPATTSTPGDQLRLVAAAMAIPTFAAVVAQPSVTLPVAGTMWNFVQSVGSDGVVGVKSGFTQAAMGCLVLAAQRTVDGRKVLVLAAVTGQPGEDPLTNADAADLRLVDAVDSGLRVVAVEATGTPVATVTMPWAHGAVTVVTAGDVSVLAWPGQAVRASLSSGILRPDTPGGARVGTLTVYSGVERVLVPVRLTTALRGPSLRWRLARR